jgi:hypothetical protein
VASGPEKVQEQYQNISAGRDLHDYPIDIVAILIDDPHISDDKVEVIPWANMGPGILASADATVIVRVLFKGKRDPAWVLYLGRCLRHDGNLRILKGKKIKREVLSQRNS